MFRISETDAPQDAIPGQLAFSSGDYSLEEESTINVLKKAHPTEVVDIHPACYQEDLSESSPTTLSDAEIDAKLASSIMVFRKSKSDSNTRDPRSCSLREPLSPKDAKAYFDFATSVIRESPHRPKPSSSKRRASSVFSTIQVSLFQAREDSVESDSPSSPSSQMETMYISTGTGTPPRPRSRPIDQQSGSITYLAPELVPAARSPRRSPLYQSCSTQSKSPTSAASTGNNSGSPNITRFALPSFSSSFEQSLAYAVGPCSDKSPLVDAQLRLSSSIGTGGKVSPLQQSQSSPLAAHSNISNPRPGIRIKNSRSVDADLSPSGLDMPTGTSTDSNGKIHHDVKKCTSNHASPPYGTTL